MRQARCSHCDVFTDIDFLVDVSELVPLSGLVCEACEHELVAEHHDDDACTCRSCDRTRARADRIRREAEARQRGGLASRGMELLGWAAEGEASMIADKGVLLIQAGTELESIAAVLADLSAGEPTEERMRAVLDMIREHTERAADALQALELLKTGRAMGIRLFDGNGEPALKPAVGVVP